MVHQQQFWFTSPSQFPAKSSISLSLEVLVPSSFFLPSEINVPDGSCFLKKNKHASSSRLEIYSAIKPPLGDSAVHQGRCYSLTEQKLLHPHPSKSQSYMVLKSLKPSRLALKLKSFHPSSLSSITFQFSQSVQSYPLYQDVFKWHQADQLHKNFTKNSTPHSRTP